MRHALTDPTSRGLTRDPMNLKEVPLAELDILITGGRVADGTGAPSTIQNVGVKDGRIAYLGNETPAAKRLIDAGGKYVSPGFIDIHTHYDAQILWDPYLYPHSSHGVTTFIMGNCGFSLQPITPASAEYLVPMLSQVEGIPFQTLQAAAKIDWRSTGEMLDRLDGAVGVNVGFMTGHSALRVAAMAERARSEAATSEDVAKMQSLLHASLSEGSLGFSTSHANTHLDHEAKGVPSLHANREEILALAAVVKDYPGTIVGYVGTQKTLTQNDKEFMAQFSLASQRPYTWPLMLPGMQSEAASVTRMEVTDIARDMGAELRVQAPSCPLQQFINFFSGLGYNSFPGIWNETYRISHEERRLRFADPVIRARLAADAATLTPSDTAFFMAHWHTFQVASVKAESNRKYLNRIVGEIAAAEGKTPFDVVMDIALADDLKTIFVAGVTPAEELDVWRFVVRAMRDSRTIWGGDDGGAHMDQLELYSHSTRFLAKAVREYGLSTVEEAVHHFSKEVADYLGLKDRGSIALGNYADLLIFDLDRVNVTPPELKADLPAGGERLFTGCEGFEYVIVNGVAIVEEEQYTTKRPGRVLRGGRDLQTIDIKKGAAITHAPEPTLA
jgi:N-acyl-D-aspartate/D-glutamate deacylase